MPASAALEYEGTTTWVKQAVPALASTAVSVKACEGTPNGTGGNTTVTTNGTQYQIDTTVIADTTTGGKRIKVKAPRSITSMKFGLKVDQTKYTPTGTTTEDDTELLGWVITETALAATQISSSYFYQSSWVGTTIDSASFVRNDADEYVYTYNKSDTEDKWENISNKTQYFYAVNRAGLICPNPIIIEFVENPVPSITSRTYEDVEHFENINYVKGSSTITFVGNKYSDNTTDVPITKAEFYIGSSSTPALTKDFTASPVTTYTLPTTETSVLPTLMGNLAGSTLTVKLYTATEESAKYELTKSGYSTDNKWTYDDVSPEIMKIFVPGIKEGTTSDASAVEYWSTGSDKTDLFITLKEENSGVRIFDFKDSTIKLTSASRIYNPSTSEVPISTSFVTIDTENNTLTINKYSEAIRSTTAEGVTVKITNIQLVAALSSDTASDRPKNKVNLELTDIATKVSVPDATNHVHERFALDDTTTTLSSSTTAITGFNYEQETPVVTSGFVDNGFLRDRAAVAIGNDFEIKTDGTGTFDIPVNNEFTNERQVTATFTVVPRESGITRLTVTGATFVNNGSNATTIDVGSNTSVDYTLSDFVSADTTNEGYTITFSNNKVYKGTSLNVVIHNLHLPDTNGEKTVTIKAINKGEKYNTPLADTITLDKDDPVWNWDIEGDGPYATGLYTIQTSDTIYPRSTGNDSEGNPVKAYGLVVNEGSSQGVYFYTKGDDTSTDDEIENQLVLRADVTESNLPASHIYFKIDSDSGSIVETGRNATTAYPTLDLTPAAGSANPLTGSCTITTYVIDKAGNKSANKTFTLVKDAENPASITNRITFEEPMKDGASAGKVFRGAPDAAGVYEKYVLKALVNSNGTADTTVDPYKIKIKLGTSVGTTGSNDKAIDGSNISTALDYAFHEIYRTDSTSLNDDFTPGTKAPIEYFKIKLTHAETGEIVTDNESDWIPILNTTPTTVGVVTVTGGSTITIDLPKLLEQGQSCPTINIVLKDGCGNKTSTIISPDNSHQLEWVVDGAIGSGSYSVKVKFDANNDDEEDEYTVTNDSSYVVIDNPYDGTSNSGGLAVTAGVTYYNKYGTGTSAAAPKLKLSYTDECNLPASYAGNEYSLRGRLIAGNWNGDAPSYAEFDLDESTSEVTLTRKWATDWIEKQTQNTSTAGVMEFDFPAEKVASDYTYSNAAADSDITGSAQIASYELWYVVEDAVGNYRIRQVKNHNGSSDVKKWMYDNHAPTLESFTSNTEPGDVQFERVNKDSSGKYYYSSYSKTTYTIHDDKAGILTNTELSLTTAGTNNKREAKTTNKNITQMPVGTPTGTTNVIPYVDVWDLVGNKARLYLTIDGTWIQQKAPTLVDTPATFTGTNGNSSVSAATTQTGRFYVTKSGSTDDGMVNTVMAERAITDVTAKFMETGNLGITQKKVVLSDSSVPGVPDTEQTDDSMTLLGWVIEDTQLNANALSAFYSNSTINVSGTTATEVSQENDNTFTFNKQNASEQADSTSTWLSKFSGEKYFYAVNMAGLISQKPIIIKFAENPIPEITNKIYTDIKVLNNINYIKQSSTVKFVGNKYSDNETNVTITKAEFYIGNSNTPALTKDFTSAPVTEYTLTSTETSVLPALSNSELKVKLYTATEESDEYELSDNSHSTNNIWMYDAVAPVIDYIKVNNITNGIESGDTEYWSTENTPQTKLYIKLTETNTGAKVFNFDSSSIKLRADTEVIWNGNGQSLTSSDYEIDTVNNKIIIADAKTIKTSANGGEVTIQNIDLTSETGGNTVNLTISDYVENNSSRKTQFKLGDSSTEISMFKYDGVIPTVNSVSLTDRAAGEGGDAETDFTNEEYVNATVNVNATSSGIYKITVDGATFDDTTKVNGKEASDADEGFEVSADGSTITLVTGTGSSVVNRLLKGTTAFDIVIENVKLPSGDGSKNVTYTVTSLSQRTSDDTASGAQASITLDKTDPVWNNDGVFVATNNSDTTEIYPHTSTASSGNVKIGGAVYFYTKDSINVAVSITETNRKASNLDLFIDSSTTPVSEYTGVAPGTHTVYAVDRAGNKSAVKTFYVVEDTTAPAAFEGYVTFAMPSDGNIYRGNADTESIKNYVIKQSAASDLSYQINTKLGGVSISDNDVHGTARTALDSYGELVSTTSSSPIEYYKISGDSVTGTGTLNTDWIEMPDDHIITVTLPKARNSSNITIELKDGCGNISPYTVPVNWKVDNGITLGEKTLGSPLYNNSAKGITYYKSDTTPVISLTSFDDSCYYPGIEASVVSTTSTQNYTLKTRVLAASEEPSRTDFYSTSIDSSRLSPWSYLTLKASGDTVTMTHNYPKYDVTTAYKLYYIVEDKLGNYRIEPITNGTYELWMYDNTAPTIEVVPIATSPSININTVGNTNYYSANSKLKLNVTDTQSGIKNDGVATYSGTGVQNTRNAVAYPLTSINPNASNQLIISGISDYVDNVMGETGPLSYNGKSTWVKQTVPALASTSPVSLVSGTKDETLGRQSQYASSTPDTDDGSKKLQITAPRYYTSLTINLKVDTEDNEDLLGWIIRTSALTSFEGFYDSSLVGDTITALTKVTTNTYSYTYNKSDLTAKWEDTATQYFYAVNKAGLICQNPIIVEFNTTPVPAISGNVTYSNIETSSDVNYIKTGTYTNASTVDVVEPSSITITTSTAVANIKLINGSFSQNFSASDCSTGTNTYTIVPGSTWAGNLSTAKLTMILSTATEDSDLIYLTKNKTSGWTYTSSEATDNWTYDATRPAFTISAVKYSDDESAAVLTDGTYFVKSNTAALAFSSASGTTDIAKYQYKLSSASSWTTWTSGYTLPADTTAATYNIRAVDKAGNPSEAQNITVQKDVSGPTGTIALAYKYDDETVTDPLVSKSSAGNSTTVYFNSTSVNKVTFTASVADSGAGLASPYLSYKLKTDSGDWGSVTSVIGNSFTKDSLEVNHIYYLEVYAKDALGNTTTYTYTFNGKLPEVTSVDYAPGTNTTLSNNSFFISGDSVNTIYYNPAEVTGNLSFTVAGTDASGSTAVSFFYTVDSGTDETGLTGTDTLTIPVADSSGKTYKIWIKDAISNKKQITSYVFKTVDYELKLNNGNPTSGGYRDDGGSYGTSTAPKIFYNKEKANKLVLKASGSSGASLPALYTREVSLTNSSEIGNATAITSNTISLVSENAAIHKKYQIAAKDSDDAYHVLKTIEVDGRAPSGTISFTQVTGTQMTGTVLNSNTIYFKSSGTGNVTSITLTNGSDVKDASGNVVNAETNALELYLNSVADGNKLTVSNGTFSVTCPTTNNNTGTYSIIAKDVLGNQSTLATFTLNGAGPSVTASDVTYVYTSNVNGTTALSDSNKTKYVDESGTTKFYNATQVKGFKVSLANVAGQGVTITKSVTKNGSTTTSSDGITGNQADGYTVVFPLEADESTCAVIATDVVGNTATLAEYALNGKSISGTITPATQEGKSFYNAISNPTTVLGTVYYNAASAYLTFNTSELSAANGSNISIWLENAESAFISEQAATGSFHLATLTTEPGTPENRKIIAKDSIGNTKEFTFTFNCNAPSGTIAPATATGVAADGNTVYFNSTNVTSIAFTNNVTDARENTVTNFYKGTVADTNKLTIDDNGKLSVTCPNNSNHTSDYTIIAVDSLGNQYTLPTLTLNGAGPDVTNATFSHILSKEGTAKDSGYYISGNTIYYDKDEVDSLTISVSGITGHSVSVSSENATVSGNACTFNLPNTGTMSATYEIIATDGVGNTTSAGEFIVNGNGSAVYDNDNNSNVYTKLVTDSPNDIIYFNSTGTNSVTSIKLKKVNIASDATLTYKIGSGDAVTITDDQLPCNLSGKDYSEGVTYQIYANATLVQTYTLKSGAPSGSVSNTLYLDDAEAAAATSTTAGDYLLTTATNDGISTDTIIYNPSTVNKIVITTSAVTDCGVGGSYYILKNGDTEGTTHYVPVTDGISITLGSNWSTAHTYQVIARDSVGNAKVVKAYSFKTHTTAPTAPGKNIASNVWNSISSSELMPLADIQAFDYENNNYKLNNNNKYYVGKLNNVSGAGNSTYGVIGETKTFTIPISNTDDLLSINGQKYVSYSLSYSYSENAIEGKSKDYTADGNRTTDWTELQAVSNNTIQINVRPDDVPCFKTFVFVWLKDAIGNIKVYSLTAPGQTKCYNWWTTDLIGPKASFTYDFNGWGAQLSENTDYSIISNGNTITIKYKNSVKALKIYTTASDEIAGVNASSCITCAGERMNFAYKAQDSRYETSLWDNIPTTQTSYTYTAVDKWGNESVWTLNLVPVTSLTNTSSNNVNNSISSISGVGSAFTTNKAVDVSRFTPSLDAPALVNNFADTVADLTPVTNTKKLRRTRKSSKKSEVKSENVVTEKPVQVIQSVITAAEELSETARNQHTPASDASGDAVAELTDVTSVSAVSVESVIKSVAEIAENIGETSDDSADEMSTSEILVNQQVLPQGEELVQSHSNYYDDEVVDLKLIYVVIAILLAVVAVVAVIVITRKQKVQK